MPQAMTQSAPRNDPRPLWLASPLWLVIFQKFDLGEDGYRPLVCAPESRNGFPPCRLPQMRAHGRAYWPYQRSSRSSQRSSQAKLDCLASGGKLCPPG